MTLTLAAPDSALDVTPSIAMPGEAIAFHGSGFSDNDAINVWVTNPDGSTSAVASDLSSTNGELWFGYDVPKDAVGGTYYMAAYNQTSGHSFGSAISGTHDDACATVGPNRPVQPSCRPCGWS